ncbi:MAG: acetyl-CoA carboxylase biotin carboxyl carrier protein subunit [Bacteroidia bacterium]|nr:acetyl-CoA carboxylase biotin carboxyl carrier protein subunit [Bacteroidia bacterium]
MIPKLKKNNKHKDTILIALSNDNKKYEINCHENNGLFINKKKMDFIIENNEDGFTYIIWKNKKFPVEILEKKQNKYVVIINGLCYSFSIETPLSYKRKKFLDKSKIEDKVEAVFAPMPGKIIDVLVEPNALIKDGDPILILEAMKMQNEIISNISGKIININVKKDDTVMKDAVLIEIIK